MLISPTSETDLSMSLSMVFLASDNWVLLASVLNPLLLHIFPLRSCLTITSVWINIIKSSNFGVGKEFRNWVAQSSQSIEHSWLTDFSNSKEL